MRTIAGLVLLCALAPAPAAARVAEEHTYTYDQIWRAAVRMLAVDLRFPITSRDEAIGYLLFEYRDRDRSFDGSLELVRVRGPDGGDRVRVVVQVAAMPSYVERVLMDRLRRKLLEDAGPPPRSRPPAPEAPVPAPPPEEQPPAPTD